jgi:hypothetical protein
LKGGICLSKCEECGRSFGILYKKHKLDDGRNVCYICRDKIQGYAKDKKIIVDENAGKEDIFEAKIDEKKDEKFKKVGGWLLLFCITLIVFMPLFSAYNLIINFNDSIYFDLFTTYPNWLIISVIDIIVVVGLIFFSIYAGIALLRIKQNAVSIAKKYLITYLLYGIISSFFPFLAGFPSESYDDFISMAVRGIFGTLIYFAVWYDYLRKSKRVSRTYFD